MRKDIYKGKLQKGSLRVTPQRMAVMEAVEVLQNHPSADEISQYIHRNHPNIASGTIYKTLETLVEKNIIKRVKTDQGAMRYDAITEGHHHLYCSETDRIEDYVDEDLSSYLDEYFQKRKIKNFKVEEIKLQIIGKFRNTNIKKD